MILLDTGFVIGLFRENDLHHARARELYPELEEGGETLVITEAILAEFVTHICRRHGPETGAVEGKKLLDTTNVSIVFSGEFDARDALTLLKKYRLDSYADALSIQTMFSRGIKKIASFDSDFDRVPGIKRIS